MEVVTAAKEGSIREFQTKSILNKVIPLLDSLDFQTQPEIAIHSNKLKI